jgi:hypothetical protein
MTGGRKRRSGQRRLTRGQTDRERREGGLTLVLEAWKSSAMFLRLAPTVAHSRSSRLAAMWWAQQGPWPGQHSSRWAWPFSGSEPSEVSRRLRGLGLGLGTGAAGDRPRAAATGPAPPAPRPLHSGNWKAASRVGLLGAETVTWGGARGSCSTAESTRSGRGSRDRSESTRSIGWSRAPDRSPDRRGSRSVRREEPDAGRLELRSITRVEEGCGGPRAPFIYHPRADLIFRSEVELAPLPIHTFPPGGVGLEIVLKDARGRGPRMTAAIAPLSGEFAKNLPFCNKTSTFELNLDSSAN